METILIVDDDAPMRLAMRRVLKQKGYDVVLAASGQEVLDLLSAPNAQVSLIVSDVCMPGMDGLELLSAIQKTRTRIPVVLVSAHGTVATAVRALKAGAVDYLLKPFSNEQLLKTVEVALQEREGIWQETPERQRGRLEAPPLTSYNTAMQEMIHTLERVAASSATVLIQGESGVGKEVAARHIHLRSNRHHEPFVAINCGAIPENLLESELFGFSKGAFTGAHETKAGKFEIVKKGTLLLDEISEMPLPLQTKILRVLQEKEFFPIGERTPIKMEARLVATTNRNLEQWVKSGHFREDLYYRLNVIPVYIPPLRQRREDIAGLARYFIDQFNAKNPAYKVSLAESAYEYLASLPWPGNIRELENSVTRTALLAGHRLITEDDCRKYVEVKSVSQAGIPEEDRIKTLDEIEMDIILKTLQKMKGNRTQTAEALGITTRTLRNKLMKAGQASAAE